MVLHVQPQAMISNHGLPRISETPITRRIVIRVEARRLLRIPRSRF